MAWRAELSGPSQPRPMSRRLMAPLIFHVGKAGRKSLRGTPGNDGGERTRGLSLGSQQRVRDPVAITVRQFPEYFEVCCYHKAAYDKMMD